MNEPLILIFLIFYTPYNKKVFKFIEHSKDYHISVIETKTISEQQYSIFKNS